MLNIIRDVSLKDDPRHLGVLDVRYPEPDKWDIEGFRAYRDEALDRIRADGGSYSRDTVFRGTPYFRYFRRFGQTYPVMKQLESFLKGRPFPEEQYVNAVAFLTELKTHALIGTHDADRIEGDLVFYNESEKTYFPGMNKPEAHSYPGDVTGRDDRDIIISMVTGADSRTCLREDSTHALYLIFGHDEMSGEAIDEVAEEIKSAVLALSPEAGIEYRII